MLRPAEHVVRRLVPVRLAHPTWTYAAAWADDDHAFVLDSSAAPGTWTFVGGAPFGTYAATRRSDGRADIVHQVEDHTERRVAPLFEDLRVVLSDLRTPVPDAPLAPPLFGGAVGWFGYEVAHLIERISESPRTGAPFGLPDVYLTFHDAVLVEHTPSGATWIATTGRGADAEAANQSAQRQVDALQARIRAFEGLAEIHPGTFDLADPEVSEASYRDTVTTAKTHIYAGDIFEVCTTRRMMGTYSGDPWSLYRRLRANNPAPFAAYLRTPAGVVVSASPERFVRLSASGVAESRPIKGTRPRGGDVAEDASLAEALLASEKDRAENAMIVDLTRNDLGRVCQPGSIRVTELMAVEPHPTVFQLVSTVQGRLQVDHDALDLLRACFPGGSMTGAPKIEAMKIIDRLEPAERGVYSGGLGYLDFCGAMDLSMVIRAVLLNGERCAVHTGGAITADSDPHEEYAETCHKAHALLETLSGATVAPLPSARRLRGRPVEMAAPEPVSPSSRVAIIDNYDSFTFNLVDALEQRGAHVEVFRNDACGGLEAFDPEAIVLSPGPGSPNRPSSVGDGPELIRRYGPRVPILGVCLGHQTIVHAYGGRVVPATRVMHGKASPVRHQSDALFEGLPNPFVAMRYHSLVAEQASLPECLVPIAWTDDVLMGVRHRRHPVWGVQFHPESFGTPDGARLLHRFLALAGRLRG